MYVYIFIVVYDTSVVNNKLSWWTLNRTRSIYLVINCTFLEDVPLTSDVQIPSLNNIHPRNVCVCHEEDLPSLWVSSGLVKSI